jgi:hypothetical protein
MPRLRARRGRIIRSGRAAMRFARTYAIADRRSAVGSFPEARPPAAASRADTTCGIKKWLGLSTEEAIGKAGSGCFPDPPVTGYCQTLRGTERSPQKTVMDAAMRHHKVSVAAD